MENQKKRLQRNIKLDYVFAFINNLDMSSSIWVLYLTYKGMNLMQIGLLEGIFHITSTICEVPSGVAADLWGRKQTMVAGRICLSVSCIIMLFSRSFLGFSLGFMLQALGYNLNSGSEEALVYDSMKLCGREQDYLKINSRINVLIEISQAIAAVAGGILAEYSYTWCYGACIVISLLGLAPAVFMTEPPAEAGNRDSLKNTLVNHFYKSMDVLRRERKIRNIVLYYSAVFAVYTLLFFYSQQYFYDMGLNKIQISIIMLFTGITSCLGALGSEKLYKLLGSHVAGISSYMIAFGVVVFGFGNLYGAIGALLVASFFNSALYPIQSSSLNRLIPSQQRATIISVDSMVFSIVMLLLFPAAGVLADLLGLAQIFLGIGLGMCVLIAVTRKIILF